MIENEVVVFWAGVFPHGTVGRSEDRQLALQVVRRQ